MIAEGLEGFTRGRKSAEAGSEVELEAEEMEGEGDKTGDVQGTGASSSVLLPPSPD
jgi:hypothetical protein